MPDPYERPRQNQNQYQVQHQRQYQNGTPHQPQPQRQHNGQAPLNDRNMNQPRHTAGNVVYAANRPSYSYNRSYQGANGGRRHRRPTPFLIIMIIFVIILLIVIFTSKSFRRFLDSIAPEETETEAASTDIPETESETEPVTETEPPEPDTMPPPEDDQFLICIDPGHGFGDSGSTSDYLNGLYERDINLAVSLKIFDLLDEAGYNVILSHNGEEFPISPDDDGDELYYIDERVSYANQQKVDLFVSIHCDTFPDDENVYGTRVYYCSEYAHSEDAEKLTELIKTSVNETFPKAKETRVYAKDISSAFYVTAYTNAPSALIELGFISNPDDAAKMLDEGWRDEIAFAISNAISVYINQNVSAE